MSDIAIRVGNLGKRYKLRRAQGPARYRTLREELLQAPGRLWSALRTKSSDEEDFWALQDVSFEVKQGEVLGVIGRNGAGKSTLLKILSRIVEPTEGVVDLYGRVGSLLEVGTGFHPELTGRENIFLSGAMLGLKRHEVRKRLDEIVTFAEVEQFIDTPCKYYSSGMYTRLGFSVAAHLDAEILLVDEVLAVGDAAFQKRCLGKIESIASLQGRIVLFVSHNIAAVRRLCTRALYLKGGRLLANGSVDEVVEKYAAEQGAVLTELIRNLRPEMICAIDSIRVKGVWAADHTSFAFGQPIELEIGISLGRAFRTLQAALRISTSEGIPLLTTSNFDSLRRGGGLSAGRHRFKVLIPPIFAPGHYKLTLALCDPQRELFDQLEEKIGFSVDRVGSLLLELNDNRQGAIELVLPWQHEVVP